MAQRLAGGVWLLELARVPLFGANAFLVRDGDDLTLVDAGLPWCGLRSELAAAGYAPSDVDRVLVTHYDVDHVGGLRALPASVPVYVGERDAALVSGAYDPPLLHHKGAFHRLVRRMWSLPGRDVRPLEDGAEVGGFTAYHTPGHNPGHTAYVHADLGVGLLGDLVWERDGALVPPEWWDSYDVPRLRESIRSFASRAPPVGLLCVAHGEPIRRGGWTALSDLAGRL